METLHLFAVKKTKTKYYCAGFIDVNSSQFADVKFSNGLKGYIWFVLVTIVLQRESGEKPN